MFRKILVVCSFALPLAACLDGSNQSTGTTIGAVAGGVIGSQVGGSNGDRAMMGLLGAALGAAYGNQIGAQMDEAGRKRAYEAQIYALERSPSGQVNTWKSPDQKYRGEVVAEPVVNRGSTPCRNYTHTIFINGQAQPAKGTACRNSDGSWKTV